MGGSIHNHSGAAMRSYVQRRPRKAKPSQPVLSLGSAIPATGVFSYQAYLSPESDESQTYRGLNDYMRTKWLEAWREAGLPSRFSAQIVPAEMTTGPSIFGLAFDAVERMIEAGQRLVFTSTQR